MERNGDYVEKWCHCVLYVLVNYEIKKYLRFSFDSPSYIHIAYVKQLLKRYHTTDTLHNQKLFLHLLFVLFMSIIQEKNVHMKVQMLSKRWLYDVQEQLDNVQFVLSLRRDYNSKECISELNSPNRVQNECLMFLCLPWKHMADWRLCFTFLAFALDGSEWSSSQAGCFTPMEKTPNHEFLVIQPIA
jgi:hypothetical protein